MAQLRQVFTSFAGFGSRDAEAAAGMEGRAFSKMCRDCQLFSKAFTPTDADLIFTTVKPRGGKRISYEAFEQALDKVAAKKGCSKPEVIAAILQAGGPKSSGTQAESNRFHDDKSTWTTTAKNGPPTTVDGKKDLKSLCDRTPADARGVSKTSNFARQH